MFTNRIFPDVAAHTGVLSRQFIKSMFINRTPVVCLCLLFFSLAVASDEGNVVFLSDMEEGGAMSHQQQWGALGRDTAMREGENAEPLRIGSTTFRKGLGHHANGRIVVALNRNYTFFYATIGVQWQGGGCGRVVFQIKKDGKTVYKSPPMSDSTPAEHVSLPVSGAETLTLIAGDGGDGITCDMADWGNARLVVDPDRACFGKPNVFFNGSPAPEATPSVCGFFLIAGMTGPQMAVMDPARQVTCAAGKGETITISFPVSNLKTAFVFKASARLVSGRRARIDVLLNGGCIRRKMVSEEETVLKAEITEGCRKGSVSIALKSCEASCALRLRALEFVLGKKRMNVPFDFPQRDVKALPPPEQPALYPAIERELIEWDWRMQDGIHTQRERVSYGEALRRLLKKGRLLVQKLKQRGVNLERETTKTWKQLQGYMDVLIRSDALDGETAEKLWRLAHWLKREILLSDPRSRTGPLLFVKQAPGILSHQNTQYSGRYARPGGGVYVLKEPGKSMRCISLTGQSMETGSFQTPAVSYGGSDILFSFCDVKETPQSWEDHADHRYDLYTMHADGTECRRLTGGRHDDFSPAYLPNGRIVYLSTRSPGYSRCGPGIAPAQNLSVIHKDGSHPRLISFHETHEWDPAVLNDGRIIYTRWDYVDRDASHYQHLWAVHPDGGTVSVFYGNMTLNPMGIWEACPVPGSTRVMGTAAAHHAMTAGSIVLVDTSKAVDGLQGLTRLTPDVPFPESEYKVIPSWHAPADDSFTVHPVEFNRWRGHCYRSPCALSEDLFLAAYSFDPLIGEEKYNRANMFGIYLIDAGGNKELLYRDLNIASLWPLPLRARRRPPVLSKAEPVVHGGECEKKEGTIFVQNVYQAEPELPDVKIRYLRILQVLPKTTPVEGDPPIGIPNAAPGKNVLGTVPVETDGSAFFRAPSGMPLAFQALDKNKQAVQIMRSTTNLQPGETLSNRQHARRVVVGPGVQVHRRNPGSVFVLLRHLLLRRDFTLGSVAASICFLARASRSSKSGSAALA